jgi:hypothetical protein
MDAYEWVYCGGCSDGHGQQDRDVYAGVEYYYFIYVFKWSWRPPCDFICSISFIGYILSKFYI